MSTKEAPDAKKGHCTCVACLMWRAELRPLTGLR